MLPYSKTKTIQEEIDTRTAKHTKKGSYRAPKLIVDNASLDPYGEPTFAKYGIKKCKDINSCCRKNMVYFDCNICDIHIKYLVPQYLNYIPWNSASKSHVHDFGKRIFLVNGNVWNWHWDYDAIISKVFPVDGIKQFRDDETTIFAEVKCLLCDKLYDYDRLVSINTGIWYKVRKIIGGKNASYDDIHKAGRNIHQTILRNVNRHIKICPQVHKIRKSLSGDDGRAEHDRLANEIRKLIDERMIVLSNLPRDFDCESKYNYIMKVERCECNSGYIVECKICGVRHDVSKYSKYGGIINAYITILRKHFSINIGTLKHNPADILTPINRRQHYNGFVEEYEGYIDGVWTKGQREIPTWICDGYKCAICGLEYDSGRNEVPNKDLVLAHTEECIAANRQAVIDSGRLCL